MDAECNLLLVFRSFCNVEARMGPCHFFHSNMNGVSSLMTRRAYSYSERTESTEKDELQKQNNNKEKTMKKKKSRFLTL